MFRNLLSVLALWFCFTALASAADFKLIKPPGINVALLSIEGEIVTGDAQKFKSLVEGHTKASVMLKSPGGSVQEALRIGAEIRMRDFATMVLPDTECVSACALIWISSTRRYMSASSEIGFHAAYIMVDGKARETGMGNAEIGSFLTHLGLRVEAIRFITHAPPEGMARLTLSRARALGITVFEQDGTNVVTPDAKPTLDILVERAVAYMRLSVQCAGLFGLDAEKLRQDGEQVFKEGNEQFGSEAFTRVLGNELPASQEEAERIGYIQACLKALKTVSYTDQRLVPSPSFDCGLASTEAEGQICQSQELSALDRAMSAVFNASLRMKKGKALNEIRSSQRQWVKLRDSCRGNPNCLVSAYSMRLQQLVD